MNRRAVIIGLALTAVVVVFLTWPAPRFSAVVDLDGRIVDPLSMVDDQTSVLIFTRSDCPISNRYAPEVRRIHDRFASRGVQFVLVYVDPDETPGAIRRHLTEYDYPLAALRDTKHELVRLTGAEVTPEVAVFDAAGEMAYRGRIDNRYVDFDRRRDTPTRRDLEDALDAVIAGRPARVETTRAVGCYIADLK